MRKRIALAALERLLDSQATRLDIAAALPVRSWEAIRKKIIQLRGPGLEIPDSGHLADRETIYDYAERDPSAATALALRPGDYLKRQTHC